MSVDSSMPAALSEISKQLALNTTAADKLARQVAATHDRKREQAAAHKRELGALVSRRRAVQDELAAERRRYDALLHAAANAQRVTAMDDAQCKSAKTELTIVGDQLIGGNSGVAARLAASEAARDDADRRLKDAGDAWREAEQQCGGEVSREVQTALHKADSVLQEPSRGSSSMLVNTHDVRAYPSLFAKNSIHGASHRGSVLSAALEGMHRLAHLEEVRNSLRSVLAMETAVGTAQSCALVGRTANTTQKSGGSRWWGGTGSAAGASSIGGEHHDALGQLRQRQQECLGHFTQVCTDVAHTSKKRLDALNRSVELRDMRNYDDEELLLQDGQHAYPAQTVSVSPVPTDLDANPRYQAASQSLQECQVAIGKCRGITRHSNERLRAAFAEEERIAAYCNDMKDALLRHGKSTERLSALRIQVKERTEGVERALRGFEAWREQYTADCAKLEEDITTAKDRRRRETALLERVVDDLDQEIGIKRQELSQLRSETDELGADLHSAEVHLNEERDLYDAARVREEARLSDAVATAQRALHELQLGAASPSPVRASW